MTITLTPETEAKLREKAQREGQDLNRIADTLLSDVLDAEAQDLAESLAAVEKALLSGPGKPIEQYIAEQRLKHGYPDTWPARNVVKETYPGVFIDKE